MPPSLNVASMENVTEEWARKGQEKMDFLQVINDELELAHAKNGPMRSGEGGRICSFYCDTA